jgi:replicative DNA helicase
MDANMTDDINPEIVTISELPAGDSPAALDGPAPFALKPLDLERMTAALDRSDRRAKNIEKPLPVPWPDLAEQLGGGLWPGMHALVAGSGVGKTTLALQIALEAARDGFPVGYVGLELDELQIALRVIGAHGNLPWSTFYTGKAGDGFMRRAREAATGLCEKPLPFYVEYGNPAGWPPSQLVAMAQAMREKHPHPSGPGSLPMLLVLDFLQIIGDETEPSGRPARADLRERIGRAAYQARAVARDLDAAVLVISSTARDKYGMMSNIEEAGLSVELDSGGRVARRLLRNRDALIGTGKESGEIEYAADTVTVAIRWPGEVPETDAGEGSTAIMLASPKVRHGGESWCELRFNGYRFNEPAPEYDGYVANKIAEAVKKKEEEREERAARQAAKGGPKGGPKSGQPRSSAKNGAGEGSEGSGYDEHG